MSRALGTAAATALCALAAAGCGLGDGDGAGEVELTVTSDYGSELLLEEKQSISESDTVMRVLDHSADVETRYGGGFVQSIDGLAGGTADGRRSDWFFYVNGVESPVGAAEFEVVDADRVWWDHRDWTAAMRVPAVVGSWPEPFVHGFRGERYETRILCLAVSSTCDEVERRLRDAGARSVDRVAAEPAAKGAGAAVRNQEGAELAINVLVGRWNRIRSIPPARLLESGPDRSGVFATFAGPGPIVLTLLDQRGEPAGSLGRGAGLVAALRPDEAPPTWLVTGADPAGVEAAASTLGDPLRNRYAVAVDAAGPVGVPVP